MTFSIIIPTYNGKQLLLQNLPKVFAECKRMGNDCLEIIIVDDASNDGTADWLEGFCQGFSSLPSRIIILENSRNLGFAPTVNKGCLRATGDILILLNTDIYPEKGFIGYALNHFSHTDLFGVGFMDKSIEGAAIVYRGRGIGWWEKGMFIHRRGSVDQTDTTWVSGGSCALRRSMFLDLGGFQEIYSPFYWEDIDLSYRAVKKGFDLVFESRCVVIHRHDTGAIQTHYTPAQIKRIAYRNQIIFVWRNATFGQFVSHCLWLPYHILQAIKRGDFIFIAAYSNAVQRIIQWHER